MPGDRAFWRRVPCLLNRRFQFLIIRQTTLHIRDLLFAQSLTHAEEDFQRGIDLDPMYAAGYLGLGMAKYDQYVARGSIYQTDEERRSVERLLQKALQLNPDQPAALAALAMMTMQYDWDWNRAERELQLAMAMTPNARAEQSYAILLIFRARFTEAEQHIQRALDLDPFSSASLLNVALMRNWEGRFAEAAQLSQDLLTLRPNILSAKVMLTLNNIAQCRTAPAIEEIQNLKTVFPPALLFEGMAYGREGRREDALRLIRPFQEKYPNPGVALQWFALAYAFMGDESNTVKWLNRSADRHEWQALNLAVLPVYAPFRNSAGVRVLEKRMGLGS